MGKANKKVPAYQKAPVFSKNPKAASNPEAKKQPKVPQLRGAPLSWRFSSADKAGPFAWTSLDEPAAYKTALEALHQFETMQEADIAKAGSHAVSASGCCKEARDRLVELELDDLDELFSFRLTGKTRIWCRMTGNTMSVLWWDPEHQVWPTEKNNT